MVQVLVMNGYTNIISLLHQVQQMNHILVHSKISLLQVDLLKMLTFFLLDQEDQEVKVQVLMPVKYSTEVEVEQVKLKPQPLEEVFVVLIHLK